MHTPPQCWDFGASSLSGNHGAAGRCQLRRRPVSKSQLTVLSKLTPHLRGRQVLWGSFSKLGD